MRQLGRILLVAALFALAGMLPLALQPRTGQIQGVVTDEDGPAAGVTIEILPFFSGDMQRALSDAVGFYHFDAVLRGAYSMSVTSPTHMRVDFPKIVVEAGKTTRVNVPLHLERAQSLGREQ